MISDKFKLNFNFITNILFLSILFLGGFVWADTNGVWHMAEDVQGGVFGGDEQDVSASIGYRFLNPLKVDSDFTLSSIISCSGKLSTDGTGKVLCGIDNVNDADFDPNNEKPLSGTGISVSSTDGRTVSVDTNTIQNRVSGTCAVGSYIRTIAADGTVVCGTDASGITSENDPEVGILTTGKWCTANGGIINCGQDAPVTGIISETDPTVPANIKDGVSWSELGSIPAGFADGVDDGGGLLGVGSSSIPTTTTCSVYTLPAGSIVVYGGKIQIQYAISGGDYCSGYWQYYRYYDGSSWSGCISASQPGANC